MKFEPDYCNIVDVANNRKPLRLPLYEHVISPEVMERILGVEFAGLEHGNDADRKQFFTQFCRFFKEMTYDTVSYEICICDVLPAQWGALTGRVPGPIQTRAAFQACDWDGFFEKFVQIANNRFEMLGRCLPPGMKAIGGVSNGVFEVSEDLVGLEHLAYMQHDDPQLFADVYCKIGDLIYKIWDWFLKTHAKYFCVCRFGDDLGYKNGTLTTPENIRQHIMPQYRRTINRIHDAGLPFLWHSCGNIFEIMDDAIDCGIDAKHSNENNIAEFDTWIDLYGSRIGLFGGIDVDVLCQPDAVKIYNHVLEVGTRYRAKAKGYALGSGNSIPSYVPVEGYLAMVKAAQKIRETELHGFH
jgi:uroporphyrinogen decarboxylase